MICLFWCVKGLSVKAVIMLDYDVSLQESNAYPLCFPERGCDNPRTFLDLLVLHHCFGVNKRLGAISHRHKIPMLGLPFPVFVLICLQSVSFLQNYSQPKEHRQTKRLNFFIGTFLFLYLCPCNWACFCRPWWSGLCWREVGRKQRSRAALKNGTSRGLSCQTMAYAASIL